MTQSASSGSMQHDAVLFYRDLLTDAMAADSQAALDDLQSRHHLGFGTRPLCTVLRPRFLTPAQYRLLQERVAILMRAFRRSHDAAMASSEFRRQFRLTPDEDTALAWEPRFTCPMPTSRLDAFFVSENELKFTEYNAETPAGVAYSDVLGEDFLALPVMGAFQRRYRILPLPARPGVLHGLLDAFWQWRGRCEKPTIAILDWREVPTFNEFLLFQQYFQRMGLECILADPREVEYSGGQLRAGEI